jgi:hypothetical protein
MQESLKFKTPRTKQFIDGVGEMINLEGDNYGIQIKNDIKILK